MLPVFGIGEAAKHDRAAVSPQPAARPAPTGVLLADIPLPPARPVELMPAAGGIALQSPGQPAGEPAPAEALQVVPLLAHRPPNAANPAAPRLARVALPKIITGAQPILAPGFSAYVDHLRPLQRLRMSLISCNALRSDLAGGHRTAWKITHNTYWFECGHALAAGSKRFTQGRAATI